MIMGFSGPEGAGKTGAMTFYALLDKSLGGTIRTFPGYQVADLDGNIISIPIDVEEWLEQPPELEGSTICIDEIQNFFDSSRHMTLFNRLTGYIGAGRRHRGIKIFYTVQNLMWLYDRLRWLTHLYTACFDLRWTQYGKEQGLERGELVSLKTYDCKGMYTGSEWEPLEVLNLRLKEIWGTWESWCPIDILSGFHKVKVIPREQVIDLRKEDVPEGFKDATNEDEENRATAAEAELQRRYDNSSFIAGLAKEGKLNPIELGKVKRGFGL